MQKQQTDIHPVIIIGAGAAGIAAAKIFTKNHCPYIILEARDRIGGRILGTELDGIKMDLGASWVHSYGPNNPIKPFVKQLCWKASCFDERQIGRLYLDGQIGSSIDCTTLNKGRFYEQKFFKVADHNGFEYMKDVSIWDAGKGFIQAIDQQKISQKEIRAMNLILNMTQHYEASSLDQLSIKNYEYRKDRGGDFSPANGYHSLMSKIAEGINVKFNKKVMTIKRNQKFVQIECDNGQKYLAKKVIASFPLGVLKKKVIKFEPELPKRYLQAINNLGVGVMDKILMSFKKNFWGNTRWMSIAFDERGKYPHFYNFSQKGKHILCCFITDKFALKCEAKTDKQIMDEILQAFYKIYKKENVELIDSKITRWHSDQFSCGSYTSFHYGSTPDDCYQLRKPIDKQLWMVGEHCYAQHIGTAHGAFNTGLMAAQDVLKVLKWVDPVRQQRKNLYKDKNKIAQGNIKKKS